MDTNGNLFIGGRREAVSVPSLDQMHRIGTSTPTFDRITTVNLGGSLIQGGINGIGLCGQTFMAVDRSGGPTNNNVYMLASVDANRAQHDRRDVRTQHRRRTNLQRAASDQ